jgi:hypothetical protein
MVEHISGKTAKQIRDKRREPSYQALVEKYNTTQGHTKAMEPLEAYAWISIAKQTHLVSTRHRVSETEDELYCGHGEVSRQPTPPPH